MKQNFQIKQLLAKLYSLWQIYFVLPILFVLKHWLVTGVVLCENVAFSILVLSTKKLYSSFLKKVFVFQKICFKVKVL